MARSLPAGPYPWYVPWQIGAFASITESYIGCLDIPNKITLMLSPSTIIEALEAAALAHHCARGGDVGTVLTM